MTYQRVRPVRRAPSSRPYVEALAPVTVTSPSNQTFMQKVKHNANRFLSKAQELVKQPSTYVVIGLTILAFWAYNKYANKY